MEIFDRKSHPISLTEFGSLYIKEIEEIYSIVNNLENYVYDVNHLKRGHLSIGTGTFFATHLVPQVITRFKEAHPNINVNLMEGRTIDLCKDIKKGNLDLLVTNGKLDPSAYTKTLLFKEHMVLVIPRRLLPEAPHPECLLTLAQLTTEQLFDEVPEVDLNSFASIPFIVLRPGNDARKRTDQMFYAAGMHPEILLELDQTATALAMSQNGMGATIVDDALICTLGSLEHIWLYKINNNFAVREVAVYQKKNGYVTGAMKEFIRLIQEEIK